MTGANRAIHGRNRDDLAVDTPRLVRYLDLTRKGCGL